MRKFLCQSPPPWVWQLVPLLISNLLFTGCDADALRERAIALWPFGVSGTPTPVSAPISLLGWTASETENSTLQQAIHAFEETHSGLRVAGRLVPDYSATLLDELESANPPDVFVTYSHQLSDLVAEGHLLPIPSGYPVTSTIASNLVSAVQVEGQNYCFPRDVSLLALFYNPAVFDRVGAAYPENNWSWTELRAAMEATTDANNGYYGLVLDYDLSRFFPFLRQSSSDGDLWQGDDAAAALEYFMALYNDLLAVTPGYIDGGWNGEAFGRGRAAMTIEGNWLVGYLANEFPGLDYGIVPLPAGPAGRGTTAFISCWVVSSAASDPAAALALASFLTSSSQSALWADASGNLPPFPDQATAWVGRHPEYEPFVASLAYATPWGGPAGFIDQSESVNLGMQMWYNDEMTTPELIARLAEMSNPSLLPEPTATPSD